MNELQRRLIEKIRSCKGKKVVFAISRYYESLNFYDTKIISGAALNLMSDDEIVELTEKMVSYDYDFIY